MIKALFKRHPLFCTLILSIFASLPTGLILEFIALLAGPEIITRFVRENIVLCYVTGGLSAQALVGFRRLRSKKAESGRLRNAVLWFYVFIMAMLAFIVFASMVVIIIDAITSGNYSVFD